MEVADRIVVMNKGVIEQIGTPAEVYENPASEFVYHFLGDSNHLKVENGEEIQFRPHEVWLSQSAKSDFKQGIVRDIRPLGAITRVTLKVGGENQLVEAEVARDDASLVGLKRGDQLFFQPKSGF